MAGVLSEKEKVLLVCHEKNGKHYWLLPGGGVDYGETLAQALKREFLEETNLAVEVGRLLIMNEVVAADGSRHGLHVTFLVKRLSGELSVAPDERLRSADFVAWDAMERITLWPNIGDALMKAHRNKFLGEPIILGNIWRPE